MFVQDEQRLKSWLQAHRVDELKGVLKLLGLSYSGRKQDLVDRLFKFSDSTQDGQAIVMQRMDNVIRDAKKNEESLKNQHYSAALDALLRIPEHVPVARPATPPKSILQPFLNIVAPPEFYIGPFYREISRIGSPIVCDCRVSPGYFRFDFNISLMTWNEVQLQPNPNEPRKAILLMCAPTDQETKIGAMYHVEYPIFYQQQNVSHFSMRVNDQDFPVSRVTGIKKKPGTAAPANLNSFIRGTNNKVEVRFTPHARKYHMCLVLVEIVPLPSLVTSISINNYRPKSIAKSQEHLLSLLNGRLKEGQEEEEIQSVIDVISTRDPVTCVAIRVPSKGKECKHLQCFDLHTYLEMNRNIPTWLCPVCNRRTELTDLIVDGLMNEILSKVDQDVESVEIEGDVWRPRIGQEPSEEEKMKRDRKRRRLDSDSPREREDESAETGEDAVRGDVAVRVAEVIDLTLDSD